MAPQNTHPFEQRGRLFAHNGALEDLDAIEARLTPATRALIGGDTDSERLFALVTDEIDAAGGDVGAGIAAAVRWLAQNVRLFSINFVLTTAGRRVGLPLPRGQRAAPARPPRAARAAGPPHGRAADRRARRAARATRS